MQGIKEWYNGYSWDGENFVYNPFGLLNFFSEGRFRDFWFRTATPSFLTKLLKVNNLSTFDLQDHWVDNAIFDKYDITRIDLYSLLVQTGYLTIKEYNYYNQKVRLDYPNREVALSFSIHFLSELCDTALSQNSILLYEIRQNLQDNKLDKFFKLLKSLLKNVTYPLIDDKEKYFHSIFYLVIKLLGFDIETEVLTCDGRIDAVIKVGEYIYIIEFKLGTAQSALDQINDKTYYEKYQPDKKQIVLIGVGFDTDVKNVTEYMAERINK